MRIRLGTTCAGPDGVYAPGDYEAPGTMPLGLARSLVDAGCADWLDGPPPVEAAVAEPVAERATVPASRPKRKGKR